MSAGAGWKQSTQWAELHICEADGAPIDKTLCEPLELFERDARGGGKRLQSDIISDVMQHELG